MVSRLCALVLMCLLVAPASALAARPDSAAPRGASPDWLPDEEWVNERWLPFDEARLYAALGGMARFEVHSYLDRTRRPLTALARKHGLSRGALVSRLLTGGREAALRRRLTRRVLSQPHLADHMLSHGPHLNSLVERTASIYGVSPARYVRLWPRLSRLEIARRSGIGRRSLKRRLLRAALQSGRRGVARGVMSPRQLRARQGNIAAHLGPFMSPRITATGATAGGSWLCPVG